MYKRITKQNITNTANVYVYKCIKGMFKVSNQNGNCFETDRKK